MEEWGCLSLAPPASLHKASGLGAGPAQSRWFLAPSGLAPLAPTAWRMSRQAPGQKPASALGSGEPPPAGIDPASLTPPTRCVSRVSSPVFPPVPVLSPRAEPLASPPAPPATGVEPSWLQFWVWPRSLLPAAPHAPRFGPNNKPGSTCTCCCVSLGWEAVGGSGVHPGALPSLPALIAVGTSGGGGWPPP